MPPNVLDSRLILSSGACCAIDNDLCICLLYLYHHFNSLRLRTTIRRRDLTGPGIPRRACKPIWLRTGTNPVVTFHRLSLHWRDPGTREGVGLQYDQGSINGV